MINTMLTQSVYFGAFLTLAFFELGLFLKKKTGLAIMNPILIGALLCMAFLYVFKVDYAVYYNGAKYIIYLLTPITVCLALPLYEQFELLKKNYAAVLAGIISGVISSGLLSLAFALIFHMSHKEYITFLPKSITTAIGMGLSEQLGGYVSLTVVGIIITGVFGNIACEKILALFHVKHPIAKGIAIGTASHAMGTSKALEIGEVEGAMSSLSIAVAGVLTVVASMVFSALY